MESGDIEAPWPAPAKLNRFLRIVGRRADGYHLLQTVFQFIDYCDYLRFTPRSDKLICRQGEVPGVAVEDDLSIRAAWLLRRRTGIDKGVTIHIDKRLPLGGGLGGGSSNAATVLVALNHYWRLGWSAAKLAECGLTLGADVPVFIHGHAAWAEGVGERLTPVELDEPWFVVLIPPCSVSTALIFNDPELTRDSQPLTMQSLIRGGAGNDCEAVVFKRYPQVAAAARYLSNYAEARLTGTGSCVFAAFADNRSADEVLSCLPDRWRGFVARGCNRSLLQQRLQNGKISSP